MAAASAPGAIAGVVSLDPSGRRKAERVSQLAQEGADAYRMFRARRAGGGTPYINEVVNHLQPGHPNRRLPISITLAVVGSFIAPRLDWTG